MKRAFLAIAAISSFSFNQIFKSTPFPIAHPLFLGTKYCHGRTQYVGSPKTHNQPVLLQLSQSLSFPIQIPIASRSWERNLMAKFPGTFPTVNKIFKVYFKRKIQMAMHFHSAYHCSINKSAGIINGHFHSFASVTRLLSVIHKIFAKVKTMCL